MSFSPGSPERAPPNKRFLVLGLDGASFDIIEPMVKSGRLPNLAKLIEDGSSGTLESTLPPVTIPAWVSMVTGKNPGKLGVFDLLKRKGYGVEPNVHCYTENKPIWQILNRYGFRTGIMNLPGTYPPEEVDGFMITGMMTPSERSPFSYPSNLAADLNSTVSKYEIDVPQWQYMDEDIFLKDVYKLTEKRFKAAEYLIGSIPCDFYMIVFTSSDRLQHVLWEKRGIMEDYWEVLDLIIGEILRLFGEETTVMVVSDHGFGPLIKTFYVNEWLRSKGYLRVNRKIDEKIIGSIGKLGEKLYRFLGEKKLLHTLTNILKKIFGLDRLQKYAYTYLSNERLERRVNWSGTKAFSCVHTPHFGNIYLNEEKESLQKPVSMEERDKLCRSILSQLRSLTDPESGALLNIEVYSAEEAYHGKYVEEAPDIVFLIEEGRYEIDAKVGDGSLFEEGAPLTGWTGTHTKNGIFIACGPNIKKGKKVENAKIMDIAPTILHIYGIPTPIDMDGKVLKEIFTENAEFQEKKVLQNLEKKTSRFGLSDEEKSIIEDRLRRLGYLS